jgi:CubicO group peptidase (beta-lactamase class C family)
MGVPVNRTLGLVVAGDDGNHILRYAIFGAGNSPGSFGHAGAHAQVGWADPRTGISFAYLNNAVTGDAMRAGMRANRLATIAAALSL